MSTPTGSRPRLLPTATIHDLPIELWHLIADHFHITTMSLLVLHFPFSRQRLPLHQVDLIDLLTLPEFLRDYDRYDPLTGFVGAWKERRMREGIPTRGGCRLLSSVCGRGRELGSRELREAAWSLEAFVEGMRRMPQNEAHGGRRWV